MLFEMSSKARRHLGRGPAQTLVYKDWDWEALVGKDWPFERKKTGIWDFEIAVGEKLEFL